MSFRVITVFLSILTLGACAGFDDSSDTLARDRAHCEAQGFATGTNAMAQCMNTLSNQRIAEQRHYDESYKEMDRREYEEKNKKHHHKNKDDGSSYRRSTGFDPGTANMEMCSDGKLREDCRNAPLGY
ncbi:MAG TPA: hypothetical protein PKY73_16605 [Hyphomonas sp.]|nr:hypothetical protein [Hyphomonas sp.]